MSEQPKVKLNIVTTPIDNTWTIEDIATKRPPSTWESVFKDAKHELHDISETIENLESVKGPCYPNKADLFAAFNKTPLSSVEVVIVGQDPYPQLIEVDGKMVPRAVGLSFSVRKQDSIPASLKNVYKELLRSIPGFKIPDHGDLSEWTTRGVLLINSSLTYNPNTPTPKDIKLHRELWSGFLKKVFKAIDKVNPYCIYLLWGKEAQSIRAMLGDRNIIFESPHPSSMNTMGGYIGNDHFKLVNETLIKQGKTAINWNISSLDELSTRSKAIPKTIRRTNIVPLDQTKLSAIIGADTNTKI